MKLNLPSCFKALLILLTPKTIFISFLFGALFVLFTSIFVNITNVISVTYSPYPVVVKLKLLFFIIFGVFSALSPLDDIFLVVTAILFGLNMGIVLGKLEIMRKQKELGIVFGAGIVSLVSVGCAACGLSLLSVLGLGSVFAFLPFHGIEFYVISIVVLLGCLHLNLGAYAKVCKI